MIKVKHSGHIGDIIYSLSFVKALGVDVCYSIGFDMLNQKPNHPSGKYTMTESSYEYLKPLLEHQPYIKMVLKNNGQKVDYDLDTFRNQGFNLGSYDLKKWYEIVYPQVEVNVSNKVLTCDLPTLPYLSNKIVINLSLRYRNQQIDYSKLKPYESQIVFVGLDDEYIHFTNTFKLNVKRVNVKDALHMAQIIKSCELFIGNQSSVFAIAEQMKHTRILELYNQSPNVIPTTNGRAFTSTEQMLNLIANII